MKITPGQLIQGRYRVISEAGCGNFAKVYRCEDTRSPGSYVAVKVLKREYATDASFELEILKAIRAKAQGRNVVMMLDNFTVNSFPCFVFKLAGPSLRSRKFGVSRQAVNIHDVRRLSQDLISTLAFLHQDMRLIHTDLKPENILLESPDEGPDGIGSGWTIADFGSASFFRPERPDSDLISTRPYRAPEVVLGMPWSPKADVWSMACILFEVYYGGRLFEVHDDHEHLNKFEQRLGKIPAAFARPSKLFRRFFDDAGNINRRPTTPVSRTMNEILRGEPEFFDLLRCMLHFDPNQRISCADALQHPFFRAASSRPSSMAPMMNMPAAVPAPTARSSQDAAAPLQPTAAPNSKAMAANKMMVADKENSAGMPAGPGAAECIPGTSIPLPPSSYNTLAEQAKAKWQRPAAGVPSAGVPSARPVVAPGMVGPSSRKLF